MTEQTTESGRMRECTWTDLMKSRAAEDVLRERWRQIDREGWTSAHDDKHTDGEMAQAASCYAWYATGVKPPLLWPWEDCWWKPGDRRRDLVKAGALILAEIERLDRFAKTEGN